MSENCACGRCAFFDERHGGGAAPSQDGGLCRFNPPVSQPGSEAHALWPIVTETDWCGHFAPEAIGGAAAAE